MFTSLKTNAQVFRNYGIEEGLPSNEIYQVYQDRTGFIWIATDRGVSRYNGYEFENFSTADGLPDNTIFGFFEDSKGRLWLRSYNGTVGFFENEKFHLVDVDVRNQSFIVGIQELTDGTIVLSFGSGGYLSFVLEKGRSRPTKSSFENAQIRMKELVDPSVSPGRKKTVLKWCGDKALMGKFLFARHDSVQIFVDYNRLYLSKNNFVSWEVHELPVDEYYDLSFGQNGTQLFLAHQYGYSKYPIDDFSDPITEYAVANHVSSVFEDSEGGVWLTSTVEGLWYAPSADFKQFLQEYSLENITHVSGIGELIFFGTMKDELFARLKSGEIQSILTEGGQTRLLKARNNLLLYAGQNSEVIDTDLKRVKISGNVRYLGADYVWRLDGKTIEKLAIDNPTRVIASYTSDLDPLRSYRFAIECAGKLWLAKLTGMESFDLHSHQFAEVPIPDKWKSARVIDLDTTKSSRLILGTLGAGVLISDGKTFHQISEKEGLASNIVNHVYNDQDSVIWVATIAGLSKIRIRSFSPLKYELLNYTQIDGLSSNYVNYVYIRQNKVYVATNKGINVFSKSIVPRRVAPRILLKKIEIAGKEVSMKPSYQLAYDQNKLHFEFLGILYRANSNVRYRYRLLGGDSDWIYTRSRSIDFVDLKSGNYTFELVAISPDGTESQPVRMHFVVAVPYWQTWWFILLITLTLVGILTLLFFGRIRRIQKNISLKFELYKLENKALRAQLNPHFIFNALNSIQNFVSKNDPDASTRYLSKFAKLIRLVLEASNKDLVPLEKELDLLRLYFELEVLRFKKRLEYTIEVDESVNIYDIEIPIFILQPYVENAIWHGINHKNEGGFVHVTIDMQGDELICRVADNGVGRKAAASSRPEYKVGHKSMGLSLNQKRMEMIDKLYGTSIRVEIEDLYDRVENPGTEVIVKIKQKG